MIIKNKGTKKNKNIINYSKKHKNINKKFF